MYKLIFSDNPYFLHVKALGELNPETDVAIDTEIKEKCGERGMSSVLVDIRQMSSRLTELENHVAAQRFDERMRDLEAIAIVDLKKHNSNGEMFELTARNRNSNVRFFDQTSIAVEWLLNENGYKSA